MKLELFNNNFERVGMIKKYSYVSYNKSFSSCGTFMIKCMITKELLEDLKNTEYILLEDKNFGILDRKSMEDVSTDTEILLKGQMLKHILSYRTLYPQFQKTGTPEEVMHQMLKDFFINNANVERNVDVIKSNYIGDSSSDVMTLQVTGSNVLEQQQKIATQNGIRFDFDVKLQKFKEGEALTNISELEFVTEKVVDRSKNNVSGNTPVMFSYSMGNLEKCSYDESKENYKNCFIVAGEGEKVERKIEYVSDEKVKLQADENTLCLLHFEDLTDEVERTFTMTKGTTTYLTNQNHKFGSFAGYFPTEATTGFFQFTMPTLPAGDVTFEWWEYRVEPYSTTSGPPYVLCTDNSTNAHGARLMRDVPGLEYLVGQIGTGSNNTNLVPANTPMGNKIYNKWVHRAVVCEYTLNEADNKYYLQARFYEDGKLFDLYDKTAGTSAGAKPWAIYKNTNGLIGKYNGGKSAIMYIDELRISNVARYKGETYEVPKMPFSVVEKDFYKMQSGLKRKEIFVDAKDLQSTGENDSVLTNEEYKKVLIKRALDKMQDHLVVRTVDATITLLSGKRYVYGEDFKEGDIVSLALEPLGVVVNVPISSVTFSEQSGRRFVDVTFGEAKSYVRNQLIKEGVI